MKAHDIFCAYLCFACHSWLDQGGTRNDPTGLYPPTRAEKEQMFNRAMHSTWLLWFNTGLVDVKGKR